MEAVQELLTRLPLLQQVSAQFRIVFGILRPHILSRRNELTKISECPAGFQRGIPEETATGVCKGIVAVERVASAPVAAPVRIVRLVRLCHPLVTISRAAARRVEVV